MAYTFDGSLGKLLPGEEDKAIPAREMVILERDLDAGNLTVLLEVLVELPMSPALPKALHEEGAARLELPRLPVIWECAAHLPVDLREPDLLDEFAGCNH